jgi:hypothetical protein
VRDTFTSKCRLVSEDEGAELVYRHTAEVTTDQTLLLPCKFVGVGLALAAHVKDTGAADGGPIKQ